MARTLGSQGTEALGFSRPFAERVFKTAGKAAGHLEHLGSPALGKVRRKSFCEFGDNVDHVLSFTGKEQLGA